MSLLLLERSKPGDPLFELKPNGPDEQYRFHFDMTKCIGCRCCEVACNEQNGNRENEPDGRHGDFTEQCLDCPIAAFRGACKKNVFAFWIVDQIHRAKHA